MPFQVLTMLGVLLVVAFPWRTGQSDMLPIGLLAAAPFALAWAGLRLLPDDVHAPRLKLAALSTGCASLGVYALVLALNDPFPGLLAVVTFPLHVGVAIATLIAGAVARSKARGGRS